MTYEEWIKAVNVSLVKYCGMGADWLPDYCYLSDYNDGISPSRAAKRAIAYAKTF